MSRTSPRGCQPSSTLAQSDIRQMTKANMGKNKEENWIGFDLGGTKMLAVVYNDRFEAIGRARKKTKGHEGMKAGLARINQVIEEACTDAGIEPTDVVGLGIGCPGPLDLKRKVIREAPNLGWKDVPIGESIETRFGFPVTVANDVDSGVFGEYEFGAGRGARCVVGIFPGTGIGGGCVYEGKLFRGSNSSCMEIGHILIQPNGPLDGAGNRGSLESLASRLAIAGASAQAAYRGHAPVLREAAGTDISNIRSGALAQAVEGGDRAVIEIMTKAAEDMAVGVVTIVHLLAPDVIVFGGGLVESMGKFLLPIVEKSARKRILPSMRDCFKIVEAELGDDAAVMGAAALAKQSAAESKTVL